MTHGHNVLMRVLHEDYRRSPWISIVTVIRPDARNFDKGSCGVGQHLDQADANFQSFGLRRTPSAVVARFGPWGRQIFLRSKTLAHPFSSVAACPDIQLQMMRGPPDVSTNNSSCESPRMRKVSRPKPAVGNNLENEPVCQLLLREHSKATKGHITYAPREAKCRRLPSNLPS